MTALCDFLKFYCVIVNFLTINWPNQQLQIIERQKIKTFQYFILFLNLDLAKGGASALLALSLVAPLVQGLALREHAPWSTLCYLRTIL